MEFPKKRKKVSDTFSWAAGPAAPAFRELPFEVLAAVRAAPVLIPKLACEITLQKGDQQFVGAFKLGVIRNPDCTQVHRELSPTALEMIAAHNGIDAIRFQKTPDNMRLGPMFGDMNAFHEGIAYLPGKGGARVLASPWIRCFYRFTVHH